MSKFARVGVIGVVIAAAIRRVWVEFDSGGVFVAVLGKIWRETRVFLIVVEQKLTKSNRRKTITFVFGKVGTRRKVVLIKVIFVIFIGKRRNLIFDLTLVAK